MQAAASVAEKQEGSVFYIDTGNSFSARRIAQFIRGTSDAAGLRKVYLPATLVTQSMDQYHVSFTDKKRICSESLEQDIMSHGL